MESSQPITITDPVARRKKKRRTRAADSFTGKFSGTKPSWTLQKLLLILIMHTFLFYGLSSVCSLYNLYRASSDLSKCVIATFPDGVRWVKSVCFVDLYKLTDELLGQGAYAKVQGCVSLQNGNEYAVKVRWFFFLMILLLQLHGFCGY